MPDKLGDKARVQHILKAIGEIEKYTDGVSPEDFSSNSMMFNATLRQLEVIGEASNKLSQSILLTYDNVPWARIIGLRNLISHEYFGVDDITIWNIVKINIPNFKKTLKDIDEALK
ncbi:MAG: DUF86 domain-containing protein [Bacteroidetes bacterium]|nr:DUF86 domain-containing protein [Bacteroidota bacterium]